MGGEWQLHALRVRYQETDQMGVVYHANYVNWFEIGRTEWVRRAGLTYRDLEDNGLLLPVVKLDVSFNKPARYDDWVTICTRIAEWSPLRVRFESCVVMGDQTVQGTLLSCGDKPPGEVLVSGGTHHVWVNTSWKPVRLDRQLPDSWQKLSNLASGMATD